jgi:pimeloyl-ACP methyl ester carboxylesterase
MHIGEDHSRIAVHKWPGTGPNALLIHGIGSSGASWNNLISSLEAFVSPVAIDLRGHGSSGHPATGYLYDDYISDLDRVLLALNMPNPVLIGHSLGGIVALWWAARHPIAARAVIVLDSPLRSGEAFRPAFDGWIAQNAMHVDDLASEYRKRNPDWSTAQARRRAETMTGTAPGVFRELKEDSLRHEGADRIAELIDIHSPVLLIRGEPEFGSLVDPADADALVERLTRAEVVQIPTAGHGLHRQFPGQVSAAIQSFLDRHGIAGTTGVNQPTNGPST